MKILSEYDQNVVRRQLETIHKSPQGRDLGRWFLTERGKQDGNLAQIIKEIQDVEADVLMDLYASPAPVQSR